MWYQPKAGIQLSLKIRFLGTFSNHAFWTSTLCFWLNDVQTAKPGVKSFQIHSLGSRASWKQNWNEFKLARAIPHWLTKGGGQKFWKKWKIDSFDHNFWTKWARTLWYLSDYWMKFSFNISHILLKLMKIQLSYSLQKLVFLRLAFSIF